MARLNSRFGLSRYDADEYYKQALQSLQKKNLDDAIIKIDQAIALLPDNSEYIATRGLIKFQHGLPQEARADFEAALKIHAYEMLAHYGLGIMEYQSEKWNEALGHFTNAYAAEPDRPEIYYYIAMIYHRLHNHQYALDWMQLAVDAFETNNDRRRVDASKWLREFSKIVENL